MSTPVGFAAAIPTGDEEYGVRPPMPKASNTTARGYGSQHQKERERLKPTVMAGNAHCTEPICLMPTRWIPPGPFDLAHNREASRQAGRPIYRGPAHCRCNRSEGARHRHRKPLLSLRRWAL
jgi:hypothetical protein